MRRSSAVKKAEVPEAPPKEVYIREHEIVGDDKRSCPDAYLSITDSNERHAVYEFKGWARGVFSVIMEP